MKPVLNPPSITKLLTHNLSPQANWSMDLAKNTAILCEENGENLVKYNLDNGLRIECEKPLPKNLKSNCMKYLLHDGRIVIRDGNNDPTYILSDSMNKLHTHHVGNFPLIGVLRPDLLAYTKETNQSHKYEIHLCSADNHQQPTMTLLPKEGNTWSSYLSICAHPLSGYIAVVGYNPDILDVYDKNGRL